MAEDEMTLKERRKYLKKMWSRYTQGLCCNNVIDRLE